MTFAMDGRVRRVGIALGIVGIAIFAFLLGTCANGGPAVAVPHGTKAPRAAQPAGASLGEPTGKDTLWTCAMHPQIREHHPGHCPICGMTLIPVETGPAADMAGSNDRVVLSPRAKVLAQIQTTVVRRAQPGAVAVRLLGRVDYDESALRTVTAWTGGRVDTLQVRVTGERVRRGQVVATLYSPETYAAEQDLIAAHTQAGRLASAGATAQAGAQAVLAAARQRLRLIGVPDEEIARIEHASAPSEHIAIRSPFAGTITERLATEGQYVTTGTPLYRVADLSKVWVQLDAYESDLPKLAVGRAVKLSIDALPGETIEGKVAFVNPVVDPRTRTARVRVEVENPKGELRPGMYAEAVVAGRTDVAAAGQGAQAQRPRSLAPAPSRVREGELTAGQAAPLVIPKTAPLFTGRRSVVYVEVPNAAQPTYEARVVQLGPLSDDLYPVVSGLREGERVVTEGAFALDADLQIRGGASMMTLPDDTGRAAAPHTTGGMGNMPGMSHDAPAGGARSSSPPPTSDADGTAREPSIGASDGDRNGSGPRTVISPHWERFLGFFLDNKLVVVLGMLLLIGAGIWAAPFDWHTGSFPRDPVPVDAIPDIGENQQIVFTKWAGRSPRDVEDQLSYPLTTALLGIPGVKTIRSSSMFGFSSIYVIFDEGVDFYWSRSRVLEKLASLPPGLLPQGVTPTLGPDATALGQVFWYTLEGHDDKGHVTSGWSLAERRSVQDWTVRYALQAVAGVSEVASIGGYVREYQVDVDPEAMLAHGVTLAEVAAAVKNANVETGARTLEINRVEYLVRGLGYVHDVKDLEDAVVTVRDHVPIRVSDVAHVTLGPAERRGALDDAGAPAVGGVVVARYGENPLAVIERVKEKIARSRPACPGRPWRTEQ